MTYVCEMVWQLCMLVGACTLCMQLLPSGALREHIRLACGFMLLHMMLSKLLAWGAMG